MTTGSHNALDSSAAQADAISVRIVFYGPPRTGKSLSLRKIHSLIEPSMRVGPIVSLNSYDGTTFLLDFFLLHMGRYEDRDVFFEVYSTPGNPLYNLSARMALNSADVIVYVTDSRDGFLSSTMAGLRDFRDILKISSTNFDDHPVILQLNKADTFGREKACPLTAKKLGSLGKPMVYTNALKEKGLTEVFKSAMTEGLKSLAVRDGKPPLSRKTIRLDESYAREVAAANEIYLRTFSSVTTAYSPHSESFLGAILEKYGLVSAAQLKRAMDIEHKTFLEEEEVTLEKVLVLEKMVTEEEVDRAVRLKGMAEIIHEEVLYGKITVENDLAPFERVKDCILRQKRNHFQFFLGSLLLDEGLISVPQHANVVAELGIIHRAESERHTRIIGGRKTSAFVAPLTFSGGEKPEGSFGSLAVKNKFITQKQLDECLNMQRRLKEQGIDKYLGVILQEKGYLTNREVELICSSLEAELAKNPIEGYKIEAELGRGNMGLVYAAKQIKLDRIVALKVLDPKLAMDKDFIKRFYKEARIGAQLNHPNIVQVYDVGESLGYHYISMEYVEGLTVKEIVERDKTIDEKWALEILMQIERALLHAEGHNLIHLDIKPGNIMINDQGLAKLCDLGLAKHVDNPGEDFSSSLIVGSPFYISPEQIERDTEIDQRADIYSLGATLFHMIVGRPPFLGRNAEEIFLKHLTHRVPDPTEVNADLEDIFTPLLKKMMAKEKSERFQNHADLIEEVGRLTGETIDHTRTRGFGLFARKLSTLIRGRPEED